MKAKIFIPQISKHKDANKPRDYWGMLFVGLVFTALMGSFLIDSHWDKENANLKVVLTSMVPQSIDTSQHSKS